jgi:nucleoside phosphorylase
MKRVLILFLCLVVLAGCLPAVPTPPPSPAPVLRTVVLSAFAYKDAQGVWQGESGPFLSLLQEGVDVSAKLPFCALAWTGTLYGQPVLIVAEGVGKVHAATCMQQIMEVYKGQVKEVLWSGIAGGSVRVGGSSNAAGERVQTGDVCIAYAARDWDRQYSSFAEGVWWEASNTLSDTVRAPIGTKALSDELFAAALKVDWPDTTPAVAANVKKYHPNDPVRKPKAFSGMCAEATGDNFWHGAKEDGQARVLVAALLNRAQGTKLNASDVIAITAMENSAWMFVLKNLCDKSQVCVPFAYSRSLSNFSEPWRTADGKPAVTGKESIESGMGSGGGSYFGSITAALPILKMLELR